MRNRLIFDEKYFDSPYGRKVRPRLEELLKRNEVSLQAIHGRSEENLLVYPHLAVVREKVASKLYRDVLLPLYSADAYRFVGPDEDSFVVDASGVCAMFGKSHPKGLVSWDRQYCFLDKGEARSRHLDLPKIEVPSKVCERNSGRLLYWKKYSFYFVIPKERIVTPDESESQVLSRPVQFCVDGYVDDYAKVIEAARSSHLQYAGNSH